MQGRVIWMIAVFCPTLVAEGSAATVSFSSSRRPTTAEEVADGAPQAIVHEFRVTTDADILRIGDVIIDAELYQHEGFTGNPCLFCGFLSVFPALGADSWITTPGDTAIAGGGFGVDYSSWFDSSNDGPQHDFLFARLTTTTAGSFTGIVSVAGDAGPEAFPFSFQLVPEPSCVALLGLSAVGLLSRRLRH